MHYTGLTIYLHFLSSIKYLGENKIEVLSDFFLSLLSPHRIVITKQKKKKVAGGWEVVEKELVAKLW